MDTADLPYKAEYAKSGRASCRSCKSAIGKDTLRIAAMVQSPMFDGKMAQWYHMMCFFGKQRPKTAGDIGNFESLRYEDQEKIKEKIASASSAVVPEKKGKKRGGGGASTSNNMALKDFTLEYAKSGRAACRGCEQKILKDEIRISKKDYESDVGKRYGGQDKWHHLECFAKLRSELLYFESGEKLPGFGSMKAEDKQKVKAQLPPIKQEEVPIKKPKVEDEVDNSAEDKVIKEQSKIIYKYRDLLKTLGKKDLQLLLEHNKQEVPSGIDTMLDRLSDIMTFGSLEPCPVCKKGQLVFDKGGYVCQGNITEWTKCLELIKEPKRKTFKVPSELKEYDFLKKYKYVARTRAFKFVPPSETTLNVKKEEDEVDSKPKVERQLPALYDMVFLLTGFKPKVKNSLTKTIKSLGGKVITEMVQSNHIMAVIAETEQIEKETDNYHIKAAKVRGIHVVSEDFVKEAKDHAGKIPQLVIEKSVCNWGDDPATRLPPEPVKEPKKSKSGSMYTKSVPSKIMMTVKGGGAVDPDSGLQAEAHVYQLGKDKYNAVLSLTDLQKQKNSFYKLQLLEADNKQRYWVFRAWGRIATTVGGNKLEEMTTLKEAKDNFKALYEEKTGNKWENRHNFVKIPDRFFPVDVDYEQEEEQIYKLTDKDVSTKLAKPVQDLIRIIFDVDSMKKVMLEFELDMEKMPLGKLSKKQIQSAFGVLAELQHLVDSHSGTNQSFIDASNRFYTFIPHSFGMENPPILNTTEMIKEKLTMLDSLMELEVAYNIMKLSHSKSGNALDTYYEQLRTDLEVLDKESEEFNMISEYVKNTHAETHIHYKLVIEEIFVVRRHGEDKRYKPFKKLHNRKLLWHGSRTTNFAGILSQGLRIAPPEAPVTGYMFGKGIYFADMVSKSANYCCTSSANSTGLMLLCEVALGEMYERFNADYIEKLPKGKHSCKGVGRTAPDPTKSVIKNGVEIPLGKAIQDTALRASLLYNEYIVYDVAQVNVQYLLKMNFKYNY